jgi:hypothetical protein
MRGFHFLAEPKVSFVRKTLPASTLILGKIFQRKKLSVQSDTVKLFVVTWYFWVKEKSELWKK